LRARSLTSTAYRTARERAACSPEHDVRCSSSNHAICASDPPGRKSVVNTRRNAGFDLPQPTRVSETSNSASSRACGVGSRATRPPGVGPEDPHSPPPTGMTARICDRPRPSAAGAEQAEPVHGGGIDHRLEVVDPVLQLKAWVIPVGQATAALVIPDEG